jgi:hypothetical protein
VYTLIDQEEFLPATESCTLSAAGRNPSQLLRVYTLNGGEGFLPAGRRRQLPTSLGVFEDQHPKTPGVFYFIFLGGPNLIKKIFQMHYSRDIFHFDVK